VISEINEPQPLTAAAAKRQDWSRFYKARHRIYTGLLLFVVVVGLPIVSVPYLRNRLSARVMMLKTAVAGDIKPVLAQVGANREPLPAEYEKPAPVVPQAPRLAPLERIFTMTPGGQVTSRPRARSTPQVTAILTQPSSIPGEESAEQAGAAPAPSADTGPKYQQGRIEQEAYELLLKSNAIVAGMVQGSNPSLRFKSWDVATRGDDTYWVRLKFQPDAGPDLEYIWQVKLQANQVTPLSYNARTIS
jgi:hypothetical protein